MNLFKESLSENAPTGKDKDMAKLIISKLRKADGDKALAMKEMLGYAYKWKDIEMWRGLTKSCGKYVEVQHGLIQAWRVFKFDQTRPKYILGIPDVVNI
jgi:hypothetical protein